MPFGDTFQDADTTLHASSFPEQVLGIFKYGYAFGRITIHAGSNYPAIGTILSVLPIRKQVVGIFNHSHFLSFIAVHAESSFPARGTTLSGQAGTQECGRSEISREAMRNGQ